MTYQGVSLLFKFLVFFLIYGFWIDWVSSVKIEKLNVPEIVHTGEPVVLDCDYTLEEHEKDVVVKWFFNGHQALVYQWIVNYKPTAIGILKGRLDLDYQSGTLNHTKHRALRILTPSPELSGNYTCLVSTLTGEDEKTKDMLVTDFWVDSVSSVKIEKLNVPEVVHTGKPVDSVSSVKIEKLNVPEIVHTGKPVDSVSSVKIEKLNVPEIVHTGKPVDSVSSVKIEKLNVPEIVHTGEPVVLDCDYTLEEHEKDVVVKWFFNGHQALVYQWIVNYKPTAIGILKGRLDLDYQSGTLNHNRHRALRILKPSPELSGNYTCLVSTLTGEDEKTKVMLVTDKSSTEKTKPAVCSLVLYLYLSIYVMY